MMILHSQKNKAYANLPLPRSGLTMHQAGCYVCAIATLGQVADIASFLKTKGAFVEGGLLLSEVLAKAAGMEYLGVSKKAPKGWCIAMTDHYKAVGYPTHFFVVNGNMMIDPLSDPRTSNR